MKNIKSIILLTFSLFVARESRAQFYNTGTDAFSTKWRSISTPQFRLIYSQEAEKAAQKFASTLNYLHSDISYTLNYNPKQIDIILHNENVQSNGYVVWAPKRMEIISTPPQRQYSHDWLEQLALHEYRHVVQADKLNQGFTKGLSYVFGEMGTGAVMAYFPKWLLEGDAVATETALTSTGRGRDPGFIKEIKAPELQRSKRYTYDEFYLGSYKDYVPNHYYYGYHMVAWSRYKYGADTWDKVINNIAKKPFIGAPLYFKLKKETGESKVSLYEHTMDYLNTRWVKEDEEIKKITQHQSLFTKIGGNYESNYVSYRYPFVSGNGNILALRTSIDDIARIVEISEEGDENILTTLGYFQGSRVSYSEKYIIWDEVQPHLRWEQKNYSIISIYNRETKKINVLKNKSRHFNPDISPDNKKLVLVHNDGMFNSFLEIWDLNQQDIIKQIPAINDCKFLYPCWLNNYSIAVICLNEKGKSIRLYDLKKDTWQVLVPSGFENISWLEGNNKDLYFTSTLGGRENVFYVNTDDRNIYQIINDETGSNFASLDSLNKRLVFSVYSSEGYKLAIVKQEDITFSPIKKIQPYSYELAETIAQQELINIQDSLVPQKIFESKKYAKGLNILNVHSWLLPFYINFDELPDEQLKLYPGITLLSQNALSSVTSSFSYYYKDGYHHFRPGVSVRMFYPVLSIEYEYVNLTGGNTSYAARSSISDNLSNYYTFIATISQPLNLSKARYNLRITPLIQYRYSNFYVIDSINRGSPDFYYNQNYYSQGYSSVTGQIFSSISAKMAYKDLRPRWGLSYLFNYKMPVKHEYYWSDRISQTLTAYLPGLFRHHSFRLYGGHEMHTNGDALLFNKFLSEHRLSLARGYSLSDIYSQGYDNSAKLSVDYAFPILYPNLSLGPILYFKRVQALLYYDSFSYSIKSSQTNQRFSEQLTSVGTEIGIETNFFRFYYTFTPTFQFNYLINYNKLNWGFFFNNQFTF